MHIDDSTLAMFLRDAGLVGNDTLETIAAHRTDSDTLADALLRDGVLSPDELTRVQAHLLGIPHVTVREQACTFETLATIPEPIARANGVVAYDRDADSIFIAGADSTGLQNAIAFLEDRGWRVRPHLTDQESVRRTLRHYQRSLKETYGDAIRDALRTLRGEETTDSADDTSTAARLFDAVLAHALTQSATDIHISPDEQATHIRYRINGLLHPAMTLTPAAASALAARVRYIADMENTYGDGRFVVDAGEQSVSVRFSIVPIHSGARITLRVASIGTGGFSLEGLGLDGYQLEAVCAALSKRSGLILVSGPRESGVTTTMYTMLDVVRTPQKSIGTIEEHVETLLPGVTQTALHQTADQTYARGIRMLMRSDTDIIMVGDISDADTAAQAVTAAATGHLVIAGITADSAAHAIARCAGFGVDAAAFARVFLVATNQRRVLRRCESETSDDVEDTQSHDIPDGIDTDRTREHAIACGVLPAGAPWNDARFYTATPSDACPDGYAGYTGIFECIPQTAVHDCIARGASPADIDHAARAAGMCTFVEDGVVKAMRGVTTCAAVSRAVAAPAA